MNYTTQDRAVDDYDMIVAKLSKKQQERTWRDAKQYDVELGRPHLRDPFSTRSLHAPLDRYWKTLDVDGHGMMAYVDIPKIHVKLPVYHGTSDSVLMKGTGHIATTHLPTDNRTIHSIITGHTGIVGHIFFDNLTQMKVGDTFQIRVLSHRLSYRVDQITVIWPTQVKSLQPVPNRNYVTLLTCYPYGVNDHRLLVRGHFIGEDKPMTQPTGLPRWFLWLFLIMTLLCVTAEILCRKRRTRNRRLLDKEAKKDAGGKDPDAKDPDAAKDTDVEKGSTTVSADAAATAANISPPGISATGADKGDVTDKTDETEGTNGTPRLRVRRLRRANRWLTLGIWVFSLLALFFAWASFALMMNTGFLPAFDLGYSWFDTHIAYWFGVRSAGELSMPINLPLTF